MKAVLHDGTELNFPEGTDPAVVQATVQRVLQSRQVGPPAALGGANPPAVGGSPPPGPTNAPERIGPMSLSDTIHDNRPLKPTEGMLKPDGSSGILDRMGMGLANVGIKAGMGVKGLFTDLSPEDQQVLAMSDADVDNSGFAGKAANLVGNVGLGVATSILTPGAGLLRPLGAVGSTVAKGAIGSGAQEYVFNPEGDRLKNAEKAAVLGAALPAAAMLLKKGGTQMFKPTQDADALFAQGVNPTLQQAAESRVGKFVGGLTSGFTDVRNRQEQEVADALTSRISDGKIVAHGSTVGQRTGMLNDGLNTDYDAVLGNKTFPMNNRIRDEVLLQADNVKKSGGRFINQQSDARSVLDNIIGSDRNSTRMGIDRLRSDYMDPIQQAIADAKDPLVEKALVNAKNVLIEKSRNAKLTPEELSTVQYIDKRYFDLQRMREAGDINQEGISISALSNAYKKAPGMNVPGAYNATNEDLIGPAARTLGKTPRQDESRTLLQNIGRVGAFAGGMTVAPQITAPLYAISAAGQTARGAKALTGQYDAQRALKSALESPQTGDVSLANLLRALRDNSSSLGSSLTGN